MRSRKMLMNIKYNGYFLYKILYIFMLILMPSFAKENSTQLESFFYRVLDKGVISINTASKLIPSLDDHLPPAGSLPIDIEINRIARLIHKSPIFPGRQAKINQREFLIKNRNTFLKWTKRSFKKINNYFDASKGSLDALNSIQRFTNVLECIKSGKTQEQCAKKYIVDIAISKSIGSVIGYFGLGTLATGAALVKADIEAVKFALERFYQHRELIKDEEKAEKQKRDRMALGANVRSMKFYLELMLVRYEQNQNISGEHLLKFWGNAEDSFRELKATEKEFTSAWEKIKNKNYPNQLQSSCEKSFVLSKQCNALINSYMTLTGSTLPKSATDISSNVIKFKDVLNTKFNDKCMSQLDNIRKDIDSTMKGKVDLLYYWYKRLETSIAYARYAEEKYYADKKRYIQRNQNLNQHYEQQLADRYGKDGDIYKKGVSVLDRIKDKIKNYLPDTLKQGQLMGYIDKRLNILKDELKYKTIDLNALFKNISTHIEAISKTEKNFQSIASVKSEELASSFKTCIYAKINEESNSCKNNFSTKLENIKKEIISIKEFADGKQNKCAEIQKLLDNQQKQIDTEKKVFLDVKTHIKEFVNKMKNAEQTKEKLDEVDKKIEKLILEIEDLVSKLGELSLEICKKTETLNDYKIKDDEHEKTFQWIEANNKDLRTYLEKIIEHYKKIELHKQKISTIMGDHKTIKTDEINIIDEGIKKMEMLSAEIDATVAEANQKLTESLKDVSVLYSRKQEVKEPIKNLGKECKKELKDEIKALYEQLNAIKISRCSKSLEPKITDLKSRSKKIKQKSDVLTEQMAQNKKQFKEYMKNIEKIKSIKKNRETMLLLVKSYFMKSKRFAVDGAICVVLSQRIMKKVFMPRVIGLKLEEATRILHAKGLYNISKEEAGAAPSKNVEESVLTQTPLTKKRVKKETQIRLTYYGNYVSEAEKAAAAIDAALANTYCMTPNTKPMWDYRKGKAVCACIQGTVKSKITDECIDSKQAALENADCSKWPGTKPAYENGTVMCVCKESLVPNKAMNACITQEEADLENVDCSKWPGSIPGYKDGEIGCVCAGSSVTNKAGTACISQQQAAMENTNCQNGEVPVVLNDGTTVCQCPQRTWWVESLGKCASSYEMAQDCDNRYPGSEPQWDTQSNRQVCKCPNSTQWNQALHRCMNNKQEVCGDGIDNNGNNQIDEGCNYALEIILDDNECPDDTMGLIVDGYNLGNNPAGHKRHYNLSGLSRGNHTIKVLGVKSGGNAYRDKKGKQCSNKNIITYSIEFGYGIKNTKGRKKSSAKIKEGESRNYTIKID